MSASKRRAKARAQDGAMPDTYGVPLEEIRRRLAFLEASPRLMRKSRNRTKVHAYRMELLGDLLCMPDRITSMTGSEFGNELPSFEVTMHY